MNHPYLLHHISEQLHTFVREYPHDDPGTAVTYTRLKDFSDEPYGAAAAAYAAAHTAEPGTHSRTSAPPDGSETVSRTSGQTEGSESFNRAAGQTDDPALFSWISGHPDIPETFSRISWQADAIPLIMAIEDQLVYARIPLDEADYLIGPVRFTEPVFFSYSLSCRELGLEENIPDRDFLTAVPLASPSLFNDLVLLLYNAERAGTEADPFLSRRELFLKNYVEFESRIGVRKNMAELMLTHMDDQIVHNTYNHEVREKNAIRDGDLEGLKRVLEEDFTGRYGVLSFDPLRQEIDMGIVTITIASRAAIEGGLHQEQAFYMSDITIQQLEAAQDVLTARHIYREAEYTLTGMVRKLKERKKQEDADAGSLTENRHISHCKDYIFTHLHQKLTVGQVASALSLDRSYLSRLFSLHEHMSMKQFIVEAKIDLAKNMLIYSSYSYSRIAAYLGFASQSHLGTEFKKLTGMTLKAFRDTYARDDFIHDQLFNT